MTIESFAALLHARRIGRGKWLAHCPAHKDRHASLSISPGKKHPFLFKCQSAGCTANEILAAMGLTWGDVLGERRALTPEMRTAWTEQERLRHLEASRGACILNQYWLEPEHKRFWKKAEQDVLVKIQELRDKLYPEESSLRSKRTRVHRAIEKYGWDQMWEKFLASPKGKAEAEQYGRINDPGSDGVHPEAAEQPSGIGPVRTSAASGSND